MNLPTARDLANAIANNSMTREEKQKILDNLPYLSKAQIIHLFLALKEYQEEEKKFLKKIERLDLKYKIKIEETIKQISEKQAIEKLKNTQ